MLAAIPPMRQGLAQGAAALLRGNAWYALIREFRPIVASGLHPWPREVVAALGHLGLVPLLALVAMGPHLRTARSDRERGFGAFVLLLAFATFAVLTAMRYRFTPYLAPFAAILAAGGIARAVASLPHAAARHAAAAGIGALAVAPCALPLAVSNFQPSGIEEVVQLARGLGPASDPARDGVLSNWSAGHHVRYFSKLPILVTPFGTEGGRRAMEDASAFHLAARGEEAEEVLALRRIRWVLLQDPIPDVVLAGALLDVPAPPPIAVTLDLSRGARLQARPEADELVSVRLFHGDGAPSPRSKGAALGGFRLVDERAGAGGTVAKVFEHVRGARLGVTGSSPGAVVSVAVTVATPPARTFRWTSSAVADEGGRVEVRLPYCTGRNGHATASAALVRDGSRSAVVPVDCGAVASGAPVPVALSSPAGDAGGGPVPAR